MSQLTCFVASLASLLCQDSPGIYFSAASLVIAGLVSRPQFPIYFPLPTGDQPSSQLHWQRFSERVCTVCHLFFFFLVPYSLFHHIWLDVCPSYSTEIIFSGTNMQLLVTKSDHYFSFSIVFTVADTPSFKFLPSCIHGALLMLVVVFSGLCDTCVEIECFKDEMIQSVSWRGGLECVDSSAQYG